jgi:quercetin dioxygenase-like cupin family protein
MKIASLLQDLVFQDEKPTLTVILETEFTKEIRLTFKEGQIMKEHRTPLPLIVEVVEGIIDFGVNDDVFRLEKGNLIALEGGTPHSLKAVVASIIRLTISRN